MKNVMFYGNCQPLAVGKVMNLDNKKFKFHYIPCWITNLNESAFGTLIKSCDIIVTQPIGDGYRNKTYLSTNYIIKNCKESCQLILFDSCFFNFYYPDLTYKIRNGENLHEPIDYHYNGLVQCYTEGQSPEYFIENYINNDNFMGQNDLEILANNSLDELRRRYIDMLKYKDINQNILCISIADYVQSTYKNKLLFYSMNHPSKYLLQFVAEKIIKLLQLNNTINYSLDPLNNPKCILYKSIQPAVNFDINDHLPLMKNKKDIKEIVYLYYETYKAHKISF